MKQDWNWYYNFGGRLGVQNYSISKYIYSSINSSSICSGSSYCYDSNNIYGFNYSSGNTNYNENAKSSCYISSNISINSSINNGFQMELVSLMILIVFVVLLVVLLVVVIVM